MTFRSSRLSRLARLMSAAVMVALLGLGLMVDQPVTAQVDGDTYTNPTYGYQLQWDPDVWTVPDDGTGDLTLESDRVQLFLQSGQFYDGDATACRDDLAGRLPDDPAVGSSEPYDGDGELDGESDGRAFTTLRVELTGADGQEARTVVERIDCRTVVSGEAVLAITWIVSIDDYPEAAELTDQLLSGLVIPSFQVPDSTVAGIEGSTYTDPDYGFTISWDDANWFPFAPVDAVFGLNDETSLISFDLPDEFDGDAARCVEETLNRVTSSPGLVEATPIEIDGEEVAGRDDAGWSYTAVDADYGGAEQFVEIRCAQIPGESRTLRAVHSGPIASYQSEAELAAPVFASLTVNDDSGTPGPDDASATPTGNGTPAATPAIEDDTPVSDEGTPVIDEGTPVTASPQATPASSANGDLTTFGSEVGGWSISYDATVWTPMDPTLYSTVDLALSASSLVVTFDTVATNGVDPRDILAGVVDGEIRSASAGGSSLERLDDPPTGSLAGAVGEAYGYESTTGGSSRAKAVIIVPLDEGNAVVVRVYGTPEGYAEEGGDLADLLNGLSV